jgi:hypothetical protein
MYACMCLHAYVTVVFGRMCALDPACMYVCMYTCMYVIMRKSLCVPTYMHTCMTITKRYITIHKFTVGETNNNQILPIDCVPAHATVRAGGTQEVSLIFTGDFESLSYVSLVKVHVLVRISCFSVHFCAFLFFFLCVCGLCVSCVWLGMP